MSDPYYPIANPSTSAKPIDLAGLKMRCQRMTAEGFPTADEVLALIDTAEAAIALPDELTIYNHDRDYTMCAACGGEGGGQMSNQPVQHKPNCTAVRLRETLNRYTTEQT